jgi:hypothetical protein
MRWPVNDIILEMLRGGLPASKRWRTTEHQRRAGICEETVAKLRASLARLFTIRGYRLLACVETWGRSEPSPGRFDGRYLEELDPFNPISTVRSNGVGLLCDAKRVVRAKHVAERSSSTHASPDHPRDWAKGHTCPIAGPCWVRLISTLHLRLSRQSA